MIGLESRPLAAIPSEFSGRAKVVACPYCRAVLMLVMDESGRGTTPLDVTGFDLAESTCPGSWNLRGGIVLATPHRCRESRRAFAGKVSGLGSPGGGR